MLDGWMQNTMPYLLRRQPQEKKTVYHDTNNDNNYLNLEFYNPKKCRLNFNGYRKKKKIVNSFNQNVLAAKKALTRISSSRTPEDFPSKVSPQKDSYSQPNHQRFKSDYVSCK